MGPCGRTSPDRACVPGSAAWSGSTRRAWAAVGALRRLAWLCSKGWGQVGLGQGLVVLHGGASRLLRVTIMRGRWSAFGPFLTPALTQTSRLGRLGGAGAAVPASPPSVRFSSDSRRIAALRRTGASGHVWTAPAVQEESDYQRSV